MDVAVSWFVILVNIIVGFSFEAHGQTQGENFRRFAEDTQQL